MARLWLTLLLLAKIARLGLAQRRPGPPLSSTIKSVSLAIACRHAAAAALLTPAFEKPHATSAPIRLLPMTASHAARRRQAGPSASQTVADRIDSD